MLERGYDLGKGEITDERHWDALHYPSLSPQEGAKWLGISNLQFLRLMRTLKIESDYGWPTKTILELYDHVETQRARTRRRARDRRRCR
jgi:hypothetical protein